MSHEIASDDILVELCVFFCGAVLPLWNMVVGHSASIVCAFHHRSWEAAGSLVCSVCTSILISNNSRFVWRLKFMRIVVVVRDSRPFFFEEIYFRVKYKSIAVIFIIGSICCSWNWRIEYTCALAFLIDTNKIAATRTISFLLRQSFCSPFSRIHPKALHKQPYCVAVIEHILYELLGFM